MIVSKRKNWMGTQCMVNLCFIFFNISKNYCTKMIAFVNEREKCRIG